MFNIIKEQENFKLLFTCTPCFPIFSLAEHDQLLQGELEKEKQRLDNIIQKKELEHRLLMSQLNEIKTENVKQEEVVLKVKDDILSNFADLMETELQCSICNELFIFVSIMQAH